MRKGPGAGWHSQDVSVASELRNHKPPREGPRALALTKPAHSAIRETSPIVEAEESSSRLILVGSAG